MRLAEKRASVAAESPLALAARLGEEACGALGAEHRSGRGQYLTPPAVAGLLAGMFDSAEGEVRLLDLGAGVGALTAAGDQAAIDSTVDAMIQESRR
jgi:hypothetical protein